MAYSLPSFNTEIGVWSFGHDLGGAPDFTFVGNFCNGHRGFGGDFATAKARSWYPTSYILAPAGTDVIGDSDTTDDTGDTVEVPLGSGLFYDVIHQERTGLGFDNEHMTLVVIKRPRFGLGGGGGGGLEAILMEDGTDVLMEDGTPALME